MFTRDEVPSAPSAAGPSARHRSLRTVSGSNTKAAVADALAAAAAPTFRRKA